MFTGIVEELGVVQALERGLQSAVLTVLARRVIKGMNVGDSITVNGVCLTVVRVTDQGFAVDVGPETLRVTTLGGLAPGDGVNLERAMRVGDRLGGHLVSGHVEAVGRVASRTPDGNAINLTIEAPREIMRYCVGKGSITIDGVSLTITSLTEKTFGVMIIPHTAEVTNLGLKPPGSLVNLEPDLIAKYVERLLMGGDAKAEKVDAEFLRKRGLL
ncbi:MAG TPA: riboflavin synthase [Nitrospiria bacterium]|nr:riboflavin synthase [Nitrospiria bacterium]